MLVELRALAVGPWITRFRAGRGGGGVFFPLWKRLRQFLLSVVGSRVLGLGGAGDEGGGGGEGVHFVLVPFLGSAEGGSRRVC